MIIEEAVKEQIDEIMCWFDFNQVHKMMTATEWEWRRQGIPGEGHLKECALDQLRRVGQKLCGGQHTH